MNPDAPDAPADPPIYTTKTRVVEVIALLFDGTIESMKGFGEHARTFSYSNDPSAINDPDRLFITIESLDHHRTIQVRPGDVVEMLGPDHFDKFTMSEAEKFFADPLFGT